MRPPIPYPDLDDALILDQFLHSDDITFGFDVTEAHVQWWSDQFRASGLYPRDLVDRFGEGLDFDKKYIFTEIKPKTNEVRVEMRAFDVEGEQVIFSGRSIEFETKRLHLNKTSIRDDSQGNANGRRILRNSYKLAVDLGLDRLALTAMMHGPYIWAKAGFSVEAEDWASGRIQTKLNERILNLPKKFIDPKVKLALAAQVNAGDDRELWNIAALSRPIDSEKVFGTKVPLGWFLLVEGEVTWKGELSLADDEAVERLTQYLAKANITI